METQELGEISVWVCREEKRVSGLTRRTSCGDVVRALLQDTGSPALAGSARSYCLVEKWRGLERALPNRTRILRLWSAWGREQQNVRFVLVRSEAALPSSGPRSAEARVVQSKESRCADKDQSDPVTEISQEKRRRVVRKAFRKLEKITQKKEESYAEQMETLVHLVLSQDHTIRQQTQRIHELDGEIERHEARVHTDRIRQHGINYVQETYLADADADSEGSSSAGAELPVEVLARFEEYEEQLAEQHGLLERLTAEIQEELDQRWMIRRQEGGSTESSVVEIELTETDKELTDPVSESELQLEEERIKTQLDTCSYIGLRLNTDLEAIQTELDASLDIWEAKEQELKNVLEKLDSLRTNQGETGFTDDIQPQSCVEQNDGWVEQARGLSKTSTGGNDDDSDTGLSSMHSQDSDNPVVCESLV
ncbi:ras association domain-containing protein 10 [Trichomycterus rosablanca]|uniref:ras association domain-containing protein 10 n=1 Tax=Trichomycterus rosablanca TaxID=2290929 RepID=UPI002F351C55